ncbi:MAG: hypothetical protein R6X34_08615 [Chloroflexota bacterium]
MKRKTVVSKETAVIFLAGDDAEAKTAVPAPITFHPYPYSCRADVISIWSRITTA